MDTATKRRRMYQRTYYFKYKFFLQQRRYFIEAHERALEQQRLKDESIDRFTLSFD